jgi:hypothetical protein
MEDAMINEVLCKILCHNICCIIQEQCELGIEPIFRKEEERENGRGKWLLADVNGVIE